ncbi:unnamed protein product, partial [Thlaspi arvense]
VFVENQQVHGSIYNPTRNGGEMKKLAVDGEDHPVGESDSHGSPLFRTRANHRNRLKNPADPIVLTIANTSRRRIWRRSIGLLGENVGIKLSVATKTREPRIFSGLHVSDQRVVDARRKMIEAASQIAAWILGRKCFACAMVKRNVILLKRRKKKKIETESVRRGRGEIKEEIVICEAQGSAQSEAIKEESKKWREPGKVHSFGLSCSSSISPNIRVIRASPRNLVLHRDKQRLQSHGWFHELGMRNAERPKRMTGPSEVCYDNLRNRGRTESSEAVKLLLR